MKKIKIITSILALLFFAIGCSKKDGPDEIAQAQRMVKNLMIALPLTAYAGQSVTIQGVGFENGDLLILKNIDGSAETYIELRNCDDHSAQFIYPENLLTANYELNLKRGSKVQFLGTFMFRKTIEASVEDRDGATIKGVVFADSKPLSGVGVSDGVNITTTDENGCYWINSDKREGYLFVIIPSGYEPMVVDAMFDFWTPLVALPGVCEQHNFELNRVDNSNHVVIATTDLHLANRNNDAAQFAKVVADIRNTITNYPSSTRIYSMCMGDMSWDAFWYSNNYTISDYKMAIKNFPLPVFHVMGNHDNDPAFKDDRAAEGKYRKALGPTFYSFNLGSIHYVVLDNIVYKNSGSPDGNLGVVGDRSFDATITQNQLDWLKKDLALVADKSTPIVVGMHDDMYSETSTGALVSHITNSAALEACFADFSTIHFLTGHTHEVHNNFKSTRFMEHNLGAACGTWWWTGALGNQNISPDGSPGGYGIFEFSGKNIKWYYKGASYPKEKQFRSYDMNTVKDYFAKNSSVLKMVAKYKTRTNYSTVVANTIYLNVWNWDAAWSTPVVKENGTPLIVTKIRAEDPLHTLSYDIPRFAAAGSYTETFSTHASSSFFMAVAGSPNSTIEIEVTDRFGNVYTETMSRPKAFTFDMQ